MNPGGLYTDFYELTMAQGYFLHGRRDETAVFDYFFRRAPFGGTYALFTGLGDLLPLIEGFRFDRNAIEFLHRKGFSSEFLSFLEDFRFRGDIHSMKEGEVAFPEEPCLRAEGTLIEVHL